MILTWGILRKQSPGHHQMLTSFNDSSPPLGAPHVQVCALCIPGQLTHRLLIVGRNHLLPKLTVDVAKVWCRCLRELWTACHTPRIQASDSDTKWFWKESASPTWQLINTCRCTQVHLTSSSQCRKVSPSWPEVQPRNIWLLCCRSARMRTRYGE